MAVIPDVSAIVSLAFADEDAGFAHALIDSINEDGAFVPSLFWFEIRNVLLVGERRSRITPTQSSAILSDLSLLPFEVDPQPRWEDVFEMARFHRLTIYDASYLELAQRANS